MELEIILLGAFGVAVFYAQKFIKNLNHDE